MTPETVLDIGVQTMTATALLAAPLLLSALVVGLLVGMFQAATQINEMTMTFIPKMLAVAVALLLSFPWMLQVLIDFMQTLIIGLPQTIR